jgi:hypothetical protein
VTGLADPELIAGSNEWFEVVLFGGDVCYRHHDVDDGFRCQSGNRC